MHDYVGKIDYQKGLALVPELLAISSSTKQTQSNSMLTSPTDASVVAGTVADVLAPTLHAYVLYVLRDAERKGVKTLYFLARDAYYMYLYAKKYTEQYHLHVKCRYLCVSRFSLRIPLYHKNIDRALDFITLGGLDVTPRKLLNRTGIQGKDKDNLLGDFYKVFGWEPDDQIPRDHLPLVKVFLKKNALFSKCMFEISTEAYPKLVGYLKENDFFQRESIAIVDSGWVGSIQESLKTIRQEYVRNVRFEGYYFGLYEIPKKVNPMNYHTYYFDPDSSLKRKVGFSNCVFEGVFSAPHGMTVGYERKDGHWVPVFAPISERRKNYYKGLERIYMKHLELLLAKNYGFKELCSMFSSAKANMMIERNLTSFMTKPSEDEARIFGRMDFSDDVVEYQGNVMAAEMSEKELKENHFVNRVLQDLELKLTGIKPVIKQSAWYEGSAILYSSGFKRAKHLASYKAYKYFLQYKKRQRYQNK